NHLTTSHLNLAFICLLVLVIGGIATGSAMTGLGKGIKHISNLNMIGATFLLAFVLFQSNWAALGVHFFTSILLYLRDFIPLSLNLGRYHASPEFMADWTYFYWAFWLAWTPFTGIFIARISKGRTIRQFVLGTLLVPAFGTFLWFTAFGSNAMEQLSTNMVSDSQYDSIFTAIFLFFEHYPGAWMLNILTVFLLFTFLITSIDSAIFVLSMFTDGGNEKPSKKHGILWGVFLTVFTIALLFLGDGNLLQMVSQILVLAALPFGFILFFMTIGFIRKISRP
ncbi:MAG: BCCT family transporter, partial [Saprospiraceae bacterium]